MRSIRGRTLLAATVATVAVTAGVGYAAIPSSSGAVNGCYEKVTGILRVIDTDAGKSCKSFETPISWSVQGPRGERGATGPAGPEGDAGAAGAAGAQGVAGPLGPAGEAGAPGATGDAGAAGAQGVAGPRGPAGEAGAPGATGAKGDMGDQGDKGDKGDSGEPGAPGVPGPEGQQGPPGLPGAGGTLASLDALAGIPCNAGAAAAGVVTLSYAAGGVATITCGPTTHRLLTVTNAGDAGIGTVTSAPAGISCGSTCSYDYPVGALVTLTAAVAGNDLFVGWSGACSGTATCTLTMDAAKSVTATFHARETLAVTANHYSSNYLCEVGPPAVYCSGLPTSISLSTGQTCATSNVTSYCEYNIRTGTVVTATKSNTVRAWAGCDSVSSSGVCTVTLTGSRAISG